MQTLDVDFPISSLSLNLLPQLQELPQPPQQLFIRGTIPKNVTFLAIVGSRANTPYGKAVCESLIEGLKGYPICIVSGLALGIDAIAHHAALKVGLPTVAFPGSGLVQEKIYPRSHLPLAKEILKKGGALISEFNSDYQATPWGFLERNRLVAGIAKAVVIIEAKERSGALTTARLGTEYNKIVMTIPGSIYSELSKGTNFLLKQGAVPITSSEDILKELGFTTKEQLPTLFDITKEEEMILKLLSTPLTKDELLKVSKMEIKTLNIILSTLEIKGYITEIMSKLQRIA